jgi:poly(3-hydroxybutyrate) depolymerase
MPSLNAWKRMRVLLRLQFAVFVAHGSSCAYGSSSTDAQLGLELSHDHNTAAAPALGCTLASPLAPGNTEWPLEFAGRRRSYLIHVPTGYDGRTPAAMVLNIHGLTQSGPVQQLASQLDSVSDQHGFVVVYPSSDSGAWNAGACCDVTGPDDVQFMREVVADVSQRVCIDPRRIYATGMSNGALMSHRLACDAADIFAAVAPVAGVLPIPDAACQPARPIPVLQIHGSNDELVDYDGEGGLLAFIWADPLTPITSAHATLVAWARRNGCGSALSSPSAKNEWPEQPVSGGYIPGAGAPFFNDEQARMSVPKTAGAFCEWYDGCRAGAKVGLCTHDGGHDWASGASTAIWRFFESQTLH